MYTYNNENQSTISNDSGNVSNYQSFNNYSYTDNSQYTNQPAAYNSNYLSYYYSDSYYDYYNNHQAGNYSNYYPTYPSDYTPVYYNNYSYGSPIYPNQSVNTENCSIASPTGVTASEVSTSPFCSTEAQVCKQSTPNIQPTSKFNAVNTSFDETELQEEKSTTNKLRRNIIKDVELLDMLKQGEDDLNGKRRNRTAFSTEHRRYLLSIFEKTNYPSKEILETAGKKLGVKPAIIQTWFKNTRSKQKKLTHTKNLF